VPSSLNCDRHQFVSVVVTIDTAVPTTSSTVTIAAQRGEVGRSRMGSRAGSKRSVSAGLK
jgi:hypothetical protein